MTNLCWFIDSKSLRCPSRFLNQHSLQILRTDPFIFIYNKKLYILYVKKTFWDILLFFVNLFNIFFFITVSLIINSPINININITSISTSTSTSTSLNEYRISNYLAKKKRAGQSALNTNSTDLRSSGSEFSLSLWLRFGREGGRGNWFAWSWKYYVRNMKNGLKKAFSCLG